MRGTTSRQQTKAPPRLVRTSQPPVVRIDLPERPDRPQRACVVHEHRDPVAGLLLDRDDRVAQSRSASVTSATALTAVAPRSRTRRASPRDPASVRATSPTANPSSASATAVARPIPRLAPVTTATGSPRSRQLARGARAARASRPPRGCLDTEDPSARRSRGGRELPSDRLSTQSRASLRVRPVGNALVEAALPELRLAVRRAVAVARVRLDDVDDLERGPERVAEGRRVTRSRSSADEWYSGNSPCGVREKRADGQVESRRAVLALVAAARLQSETRLPGARARARTRRHDRSGASPRRLRLYRSGPGSPTHEIASPCCTRSSVVAVAGEPAERPERPRAPEEAIRVAQLLPRQRPRERPEQHDSREVVVRERRVADVGAEQELRVGRARGCVTSP